MEQAMKQTLITLAPGLGFLSLLMAPAAHAQRYLVNGHPATAGEEQILAIQWLRRRRLADGWLGYLAGC
jgi:hypothetical protein